ncbi:MAG: hypothetical protein RLZZ262_1247 [Bacteroidota bacterium]|jgi:hypothetical protein
MQGFLFSCLTVAVACSFMHPRMNQTTSLEVVKTGHTISSRFNPPEGFSRGAGAQSDQFFRQLKLHPDGHSVHLFNGALKSNQSVHAAVLTYDVGKADLQQCADACIRLIAEYLWQEKRYDDIHFYLTNGWRMDYSEWRKGKRLAVRGNTTQWVASTGVDTSYACFRSYLDHVFMYAGTLSLSKEIQPVEFNDLRIGDVIVQGGSPGHAVIIVDKVEHSNGEVRYMLAQSYMPAQEIHILKTPTSGSVWHTINSKEQVETAEWTFESPQFGRFSGISKTSQ